MLPSAHERDGREWEEHGLQLEVERHDDEQCLQRAGERVAVLERQPIDANSNLELE